MTRRVTNKPSVAIVLFASMTLLLTACGQTVSDSAKNKLSKDVDCSTAKQDVTALKKERASNLKRFGTGLQYVFPVTVAVNIFRSYNQDGTSEEFYTDRERVLTGEYNKAIDAKIAEIKKVCGV